MRRKRGTPKNRYLGGLQHTNYRLLAVNILLILLAVFFVKAYTAQHLSLFAPLLLIKLAIGAFLLALIFIVKPAGRIRRIFPDVWFIITNLALALLISIPFTKGIGGEGILFTLLVSFFVAETEHVVREYY